MSEMLFWNVNEGYTEALVRTMKKSFLEEEDYMALKNSTNMNDFKTALEATDYEEIIQAEPSPISSARLQTLLKQKLADDIQYFQSQASSPLYEFIDLMRHGYMIEDTIYIIEGIKSKADFDSLLKRADPLGEFPGMRTIKAAESENYANVYQTVLIDLPVGKYFHKFLEDILVGADKKDINAIESIMKDYTHEKTKNYLKKIWLTELYKFCTTELDGPSREIMEDLLKFESDCMTIQIIYNSLGNKELTDAKGREAERKKYIHLLGRLYPGRDTELTSADSLEKLKEAVRPYDQYKKMLEHVPEPGKDEEFQSGAKSLYDYMFEEQAKMYALAFEQQFHCAVFYAYLKLKEQEIRNIGYMADLVGLGMAKNMPQWKKIVVPFKDVY
jgi:V-type H+-transporting ATPase subunit d